MRSFAALTLCVGLLSVPSIASEQTNSKGGGRAAAPKAPRQQSQAKPAEPKIPPIERFMNMSPEQREKALAKLPPQRREILEKRINDLENLPQAARERLLTRAELLNALPPERRQEVRQALNAFRDVPAERHAEIQKEMRQMSRLSQQQRQAHLNSEDFRRRFTPEEQEMMRNMLEVVP
jgi:hypothetical protein